MRKYEKSRSIFGPSAKEKALVAEAEKSTNDLIAALEALLKRNKLGTPFHATLLPIIQKPIPNDYFLKPGFSDAFIARRQAIRNLGDKCNWIVYAKGAKMDEPDGEVPPTVRRHFIYSYIMEELKK